MDKLMNKNMKKYMNNNMDGCINKGINIQTNG